MSIKFLFINEDDYDSVEVPEFILEASKKEVGEKLSEVEGKIVRIEDEESVDVEAELSSIAEFLQFVRDQKKNQR